ncbi:DUF4834 family protein [Muriicola sp.]|uniref:DUF4834 family protein n=1 Tax=Muriicola sp. TaxID=2020856 RepID=UPI003C77795B
MGFLKTLLIIILVYYLLRLIGRWLAPKVFNYAAKKTERHFREAFEQANMGGNTRDQNVQDLHNSQKSNNTRTSSKEVGEYIDFEEIE